MAGSGVSEGDEVNVAVNVGVSVGAGLAVPVIVGKSKVLGGGKEPGLQAENVSMQRKDRVSRRVSGMVL
jgi:hypothetical protein